MFEESNLSHQTLDKLAQIRSLTDLTTMSDWGAACQGADFQTDVLPLIDQV